MSDELRTSDAERETAVARLRDASAEGRLTLDELALRTGSAYAARTHGELASVTADLPERRTAHMLVGRPLDLAVRVVSVIIVPVPVSGLQEGFFGCDRCAHGLVALRRGWTNFLVFSTDTSPLVNTRGF